MKTLADVMAARQRSEREIVMGMLTPAQLDIWQRIANGQVRKDIARARNTSPKTVDHQVFALSRRLGMRGAAALTRAAVRYGVITVEVVN